MDPRWIPYFENQRRLANANPDPAIRRQLLEDLAGQEARARSGALRFPDPSAPLPPQPATPPPTPPAPGAPPAPPQTPPSPTDSYLDRVLARLKRSGVNFKVSQNILNKYDRYAYHLRLFMINDSDANSDNIRSLLKSNKIRKAIIAESGVTVGFNITSCEIKTTVSSNFKSRNTTPVELNMTITEPYSMSLPDKMFMAANELGVFNWRLIPIFLELEFRYYDENGVLVSQTGDDRIYKIYRINLVDFSSSVTQSGSIYNIKAAVDNTLGFKDMHYVIPQTYVVNGNTVATAPGGAGVTPINIPLGGGDTVGKFFDDLGKAITKFYTELHRLGGPQSPVSGTFGAPSQLVVYRFVVADVLKNEPIKFSTNTNGRRLSMTLQNGRAEITIGRGISIGSIIDDVLGSLVKSEFFVADKDTGRIRIPRVECRVKNIGVDLLLNDYVREFTFFITIKESTIPVPSPEFGRAFQLQGSSPNQNAIKRLQWLAENPIKKAYMYYYTGNNTEITHLDVKFNQLHIIPLPLKNPTVAAPGIGSSVNLPAGQLAALNARIGALQTQLNQLGAAIQSLQQEPLPNPSDPNFMTLQRARQEREAQLLRDRVSAQAQLEALEPQARNIQGIVFFDPSTAGSGVFDPGVVEFSDANTIRQALNNVGQQNARSGARLFIETIKSNPPTHLIGANNIPNLLTYTADPRDIIQQIRSVNTASAEDASRRIYSTITSQIYDNIGQMLQIEMEIRGDPYWLGVDNLERTEELNVWYPSVTPSRFSQPQTPSPPPPGVQDKANDNLGASNSRINSSQSANFFDYDGAFVLLFRSGIVPDEKTGYMDLNANVEFFSAIYRCIEVTHIFKDGKFLQRITATKDDLTSLNVDSQQSAPNPSQPPSVPSLVPAPGLPLGGRGN